jgi:hypothetical protein
MIKTAAVLVAGELYLLPVPAEPVCADVPGIDDLKTTLAQHGDERSGICGADHVDVPQGDERLLAALKRMLPAGAVVAGC